MRISAATRKHHRPVADRLQLQLVAASGIIGGFVYWLLAGWKRALEGLRGDVTALGRCSRSSLLHRIMAVLIGLSHRYGPTNFVSICAVHACGLA
jgi:hypothetical protein